MTTKEKALELVEKFENIKVIDEFHFGMEWHMSKQCALIAVYEMLNNAGFIWGGRDTETGKTARDTYRDYWNQVKQEIEKL